jgi:tight adherence protein B
MNPTLLIVAVLAFVAVFALASVFNSPEGDKKALRRLRDQGRKQDAKRHSVSDSDGLKRRQNTQDALKALAEADKKSRKRRLSIKGQIAQAGLSITEMGYWIAAAGLAGVLALLGLLLQGPIGAAVGAFIGLLGLPRWVLGFLVNRRQKKFLSQFADGIDMIVRGVKSGLPLNQCLRMIASESNEPLKSEFQHLIDGQAMGVPFDANLQRFYERMPLPEVNFFGIVLLIQQKTGGNLSESLFNLSTVLRSRKMLKEKVKALSSEAKASAMIIGSLPFIVMALVYMVRPDYMTLLFTTTPGNVILLCCGFMMSLGILTMNKMVNFKF